MSVGATYRAAGAHRLALRLVLDWFWKRLAKRAGLPASASPHEVAVRLARRAGAPPERYETLLNDSEAAAAEPRLTAHRLSWLASRLAQMEAEVLDGRKGR